MIPFIAHGSFSSLRPLPGALAALGLAVAISGSAAQAAPSRIPGEDDLRDKLVLKQGKGRELAGRVIERYLDDDKRGPRVLFMEGSKRSEIPLADIASMETVRDRLRTWLGERKQGLNIDQKWALVDRAKKLQLPEMARLQALAVVLDHPDHVPAHEFLGHERRGQEWRWSLNGKQLSKKKLGERIRDWQTRLVLKSEHYSLETDAGFRAGVNLLMDLEQFYLYWMDTFGEDVRAAETVDEPNIERMTWEVHRERSSYKNYPSERLEPYYDPSPQTSGKNGSMNLAMTYFIGSEDYKQTSTPRPKGMVDLAVQQLLYSTLLLSRTKGGAPDNAITRHSHWLEVGFGYWLERQWVGETGYPELIPFRIDPDVAEDITRRASGRSPLTKHKRDIVNVIGLEAKLFYGTGKNVSLHINKSRGLFAFLMEQPLATRAESEPLLGTTRAALLHLMGLVYQVPKAHSSRDLDRSLALSAQQKKAKIEDLYEPWREWGATQAKH